ncbi:hypothetical protein [Mycobacterium sp. E183]|uniref:hypothetical protein n=1 Tax=Mycobacterium sp. E183 TaxID=1834129 RepID=UPI0007FE59CA|nr:hypothetical protein [Mycobacterium sp. E183]OBH33021.1 hypothetical protein A5691_11050 [Mycobacterium sp. E183]
MAASRQGDDVVLRGDMTAVPDVAAADVLLALAGEDGGRGLFAIRTDSPGVSVEPERGIDQTRKRFRVTLDSAPARRRPRSPPGTSPR